MAANPSVGNLNLSMSAPQTQNVVKEERATESCTSLTLKQRLGKLLCEIFEGHEEYLGVTPD